MSKLTYITDIYNKTVSEFNKDANSWVAFLNCAAMNYKYSFVEQVLIYAQKPNAVACADIDTWNNKLNRWVNKGAKGIALITETNGYTHLKYLFDVSDTNNRYGKEVQLWSVPKNLEQDILESLDNKFGPLEVKEDFISGVKSISNNLVEDNLQDYNFNGDFDETRLKVFIKDSVSYIILRRCGYNAEEYFTEQSLNHILRFSDTNLIENMGIAISDISTMGISEIYKSLKNVRISEMDKIRTLEGPSKKEYYEYEGRDSNGKLQETRGLRDSEFNSKGEKISESREVRTNETELLEESQEERISEFDSQRSADRIFERNSGSSRTDGGTTSRTNGSEREDYRGNESNRSNEMGGTNEQSEISSRRNSDERVDLQLELYESSESYTTHYFLVDEKLNQILSNIELKVSNNELKKYFDTNKEAKLRAEFLKNAFNIGEQELVINDINYSYKVFSNGLLAWKGDYANRDTECFTKWEELTHHYQSMLMLQQLPILPSVDDQLYLIEENNKQSDITFTQEFIDEALCLGSYIQDGKYRIYEQFSKSLSSKENADFLKEEFGIGGGSSHTIRGSGIGMECSAKGYILYRGYFENRVEKLFTWSQLAKRIDELIKLDRYLNYKEKEHYPTWLEEKEQERELNAKADFLSSIVKNDTPSLAERIHNFIKDFDTYEYWDNKEVLETEDEKIKKIEGELQNPEEVKGTISYFKEVLDDLDADNDDRELVVELIKELDDLFPTYEYHLGDKVYLGAEEYEILAFDEEEVRLYDYQYPLFNKELTRDDFDRKVRQTPANEHLIVKIKLENEKYPLNPFTRWLDNFIEERGINLKETFSIEIDNNNHIFEIGSIIENMKKMLPQDQVKMKEKLIELDFNNIDVVEHIKNLVLTLSVNYEILQNESNSNQVIDELDFIDNILEKHGVYDIYLKRNSNGEIVALDDDNEWVGKEFYDFLLNDLIVLNKDGTSEVLTNKQLEKVKQFSSMYNYNFEKELFFVDKEKSKVELLYYNSDSEDGGQFITDTFSFEDIRKSAEIYSDSNDFFDYIQSYCHRELADVGTQFFEENKERYNSSSHTFEGCTDETMNSLISLVQEKNIDKELFINTNESDKIDSAIGRTIEYDGYKCIVDSFDSDTNCFLMRHIEVADDVPITSGIMLDKDKLLSILENQNNFGLTNDINIIGKELEIDNRKYIIESVGELTKEVTLTDITFQNSAGFPINRIEKLNKVQRLLAEKEESDLIPKWNKKPKVTTFDIHPEIKSIDRFNYSITDDNLGVGTPREKFNRNYEAIKLLKQLEQENRFATTLEQETLSKYIGWGGLQEVFDPNNKSWTDEYLKLKDILDEDEYHSARESVLTSFYTPPIVIRAIYKALENMNLKNANILEPSCGVGNFLGMMPETMSESKIYGIEVDSISGKIAQQLYQKSSVAVKGFEEVNLPDSFFDAAIGNVPFGNFKVNDKRYDKNNFLIHDYFFAKTLDKVRPGGIVAFITSKGTLDKDNNSIRKYIAQRADLLGAIRLPDNTFKNNAGTEVTSDIIFLQKRDSITDIEPDWIYTDFFSYDPDTKINSYFSNNPEMVLGDLKVDTTQYGFDLKCKAFENSNLETQLNEAIQNIHAEIKDYEIEMDEEEDLSIPATPDVKNFSYTLVDGTVYYRENSRMYPQDLAVTTENRIKGMIEIRDCTRLLIEMQTEDYPDYEVTAQQDKLNVLYDKFYKKYGLINNRANKSAFSNDNSYFLLCSLEILDENGELLRKADIFNKRTIRPHQKITSVDNSNDALIVSLSEKATIDFDYMRELSGKENDVLIEDLKGVIFRVPEYGNPNHWVTVDEYLSGNVREKLRVAEEFAKEDSTFEINVKALKEVQPIDLDPSEISIRLGATWIPVDIIKDFVFELLEPSNYIKNNIDVHYSEYTGDWNINGKSYDKQNVKAYNTYGTNRVNAYKIIEDSLNLRDTRVYDYIYDDEGKKKQELNKKETAIAQAKQEQIKLAFDEWIWNDPYRRDRLKTIYNEKFNSIKPREYDGSNLKFSGINPEIELREHQKNAIARVIFGGNTLLAHEVGAGKTFAMVASAMESKRLGLNNKSLFVVPNHIIEQFASEFLQLYPSANILVSTKKDFETANRKKFCSRIATGEYDAVIIGHSQFEKIPMSVERQAKLLEKQINDITNGVAELKKNNSENFTVKQLVKTQKALENRLIKLYDQSRKDDVITFEELGVDRLFVDEAHYYKNLFLYTKMRNVGGIAQTEAQKSSDLFMKCQYLDEITNSKGVVFATGTPISNSMVELYTMQRYLQYGTLKKHHLEHFDAWASTFGETVTAIELAPEGTGYRAKTRFAKFYNLPELMNMFKEIADIQTSDMLNLPVPKANYHNVVVEASELQKGMVKDLAERAELVRARVVDPKEDNMLKITNDGRKLALDQRLINDMLPDFENSKISICARNVYEFWEKNKESKLTQLIFCDISTPNSDKFNVYDDMKKKLVEKGVPENEIVFIHDYDTEVKKKEVFAKVRKGQIRGLMGSTQKMGAGTNCQDKLIALHDLDCPWRPSDLIQRSGRIIRQGNTNPEVEIFRYVTEGTFDAYLYQLVENKQRFISQIMTSKTPVRVAEDIDEAALSYAEIKALAAGNPLIIEKTELDTLVAKLKLLKQSHLSQIYAVEDKVIKYYPSEINRLETRIIAIKKDIEYLNLMPMDKEKFPEMTLKGVKYTDKSEAGKQLLEICKAMNNTDPIPIGEYRGFKMELGFDSFAHNFFLNMRNNLSYKVELGSDIFGNITRIDNVLDSIGKQLEYSNEQLENTKNQYENAKKEINRPFPQEEELKIKSKRLDEVNILLNLNEKDREIMDDESDLEVVEKTNRDYER